MKSQQIMPGSSKMTAPNLVAAIIVMVATIGAYCQVLDNQFVLYDDPGYVTENSHVLAGLTWDGIKWAFTTTQEGNWHPLTWLSHMLDITLYGLVPRGHHLTNLLLHTLNGLLLFTVLRKLTATYWRSLMVALLFALHPLHVESVAWIAERKDLLSTCFFLLTLLSYHRYTLMPGLSRYFTTLLCAACGLMAKPMLVSLPFILLLLDWWPLGRLTGSRLRPEQRSPGRWRALVMEKLPFLALAAAASILTIVTHQQVATIATESTLGENIGRAIVTACGYLGKMFLPLNLAVFYPFNPEFPPLTVFIPALLFCTAATAAALVWHRRCPCFTFGWLWYLVTLLPVSGVVRIGNMAMADRYTYIPLIGPFMAIVWGTTMVVANRPKIRPLLAGGSCLVILALGSTTCRQTRHWFNGITLFNHASIVVKDNWLAFDNLGASYLLQADTSSTINIVHSLRTPIPASYRAATGLGSTPPLASAIAAFQEAVRIWPEYESARFNLCLAYLKTGNREAALAEYQLLYQLNPEFARKLEAAFSVAAPTQKLPQ